MGALLPGVLLGMLYVAYELFIAYFPRSTAPVPADAKPLELADVWGARSSSPTA